VIIGGLLMLFFPLSLILLGVVGAQGGSGLLSEMDESGFQLATTITTITVWCLIGLGVFGLLFALIGLLSALFRRQPMGLSIAGLLLTLVGLTFSILLGVATSRIVQDVENLLDRQNRRLQGPVPMMPPDVRW
jgi:hypothetical protein